MNKQTRPMRRWLLAFILAGLLATTSIYLPAVTSTTYACQGSGGSGSC